MNELIVKDEELQVLRDRYCLPLEEVELALMAFKMFEEQKDLNLAELTRQMNERFKCEFSYPQIRYMLMGDGKEERRCMKLLVEKLGKSERVKQYDEVEWVNDGLDVREGKKEWSNVQAMIWKNLGGYLGILKDGREVQINQQFLVTQRDGTI